MHEHCTVLVNACADVFEKGKPTNSHTSYLKAIPNLLYSCIAKCTINIKRLYALRKLICVHKYILHNLKTVLY